MDTSRNELTLWLIVPIDIFHITDDKIKDRHTASMLVHHKILFFIFSCINIYLLSTCMFVFSFGENECENALVHFTRTLFVSIFENYAQTHLHAKHTKKKQ